MIKIKLGISLASTLKECIKPGELDLQKVYFEAILMAEKLRQKYDLKVLELMTHTPIFAESLMPFVDKIKQITSNFEELTLHSPFREINLSVFHPKITVAVIDEYKKNIDFAKQMGIKRIVVHPGSFKDVHKMISEVTKKTVLKNALEIIKYAKEKSIFLCFENLPLNETMFHRPQEFDILIQNGGYLTLDTGHAVTVDINPILFIERFGDKIKHIHFVDDYKKQRDQHIVIGEGDLNWKEVINKLRQINYKDPIILEYNSIEKFERSIRKVKGYL